MLNVYLQKNNENKTYIMFVLYVDHQDEIILILIGLSYSLSVYIIFPGCVCVSVCIVIIFTFVKRLIFIYIN